MQRRAVTSTPPGRAMNDHKSDLIVSATGLANPDPHFIWSSFNWVPFKLSAMTLNLTFFSGYYINTFFYEDWPNYGASEENSLISIAFTYFPFADQFLFSCTNRVAATA